VMSPGFFQRSYSSRRPPLRRDGATGRPLPGELLVPAPQEPDTGIRTAADTAEKDQLLHLGTRVPARPEP
jgi:hypothetical protein